MKRVLRCQSYQVCQHSNLLHVIHCSYWNLNCCIHRPFCAVPLELKVLKKFYFSSMFDIDDKLPVTLLWCAGCAVLQPSHQRTGWDNLRGLAQSLYAPRFSFGTFNWATHYKTLPVFSSLPSRDSLLCLYLEEGLGASLIISRGWQVVF